MGTNVANIIGGPALVLFAGASFYSKGDIVLSNVFDTFPIEVDRFRQVDERVSNQPMKVRFTPAGEWEALAVLFPYAAKVLGDLITPVRTWLSSDPTNDKFTLGGGGLDVGTRVALVSGSSDAVAPTGLAFNDVYYLGDAGGGDFSLYDTREHALAGGATGRSDFSDGGEGTIKVIMQEELVIHTFSGKKFTFHNAAVTQMPNIEASTVKTLLGEVEFECFLVNGADWDDSEPLFSIADEALEDTSFDPAAILTQPYLLSWGNVAPWDSFSTKEGVKINFALALEAVTTDIEGTLTRRLSGLVVTASAQPIGITEDEFMSKLLLQGNGAKRGRSLSGDDLVLTGDGVSITIYGAALRGGTQNFSSKNDRLGEQTWVATRTFEAGVPNPLFAVGTGVDLSS